MLLFSEEPLLLTHTQQVSYLVPESANSPHASTIPLLQCEGDARFIFATVQIPVLFE